MSELSDCTDCCRSRSQARVAIVGAGFRGLLVLAHLVEQTAFPLNIALSVNCVTRPELSPVLGYKG